MAMGWGGAKRWGLRPRLAWFYLALSPPLDASRSPAPPRKTLFLLIFLTTSTIFFIIKTYFINKNIPEITTKFIPSNQINF